MPERISNVAAQVSDILAWQQHLLLSESMGLDRWRTVLSMECEIAYRRFEEKNWKKMVPLERLRNGSCRYWICLRQY